LLKQHAKVQFNPATVTTCTKKFADRREEIGRSGVLILKAEW